MPIRSSIAKILSKVELAYSTKEAKVIKAKSIIFDGYEIVSINEPISNYLIDMQKVQIEADLTDATFESKSPKKQKKNKDKTKKEPVLP